MQHANSLRSFLNAKMLLFCAAILLILFASRNLEAESPSPQLVNFSDTTGSRWVQLNPQGKLIYRTSGRGDRIMDFSHAGYRGGGVKLPSPEVKVTLSPVAGNNSDAIQEAINRISGLPLTNGFRGAVHLLPGVYPCEKPLYIHASGVILRGSGTGENGSIIQMAGNPHACMIIKGTAETQNEGSLHRITDTYVPSGTDTFSLDEVTGLSAGDTIRISRPVTPEWVRFMGMDQLVRNGKKQTWVSGDITADRIIRKIERNTITVTVPLSDSYDTAFTAPSGVTVTKISTSGTLTNAGIENLRIVSPQQQVTISEPHNSGIMIRGAADCWLKDLVILNAVGSVAVAGNRITVDSVRMFHDFPTLGAAKPADLSADGGQVLFNRCYSRGNNLFYFVTGAKVSGPVVLLNCVFEGGGWIQPHQRWATGLLVDGCQVPDGGIEFMNRGEMGSGHGWTIGWAVAWNCQAHSLVNQQPPGSINWMIGCRGERQRVAMPFDKSPLLPEAVFDSYGVPVSPASLYLAQLSERLGKRALKNIGY